MILLLISLSLWPPAVTSLVRGDCPYFWEAFNGTCYTYFDQQLRYDDAKDVCRRAGGNLASVHSAEENQFILSLTGGYDGVFPYAWLGGLVDGDEGKWCWMDGSEFDFQNWAVDQPSQCSETYNNLVINYRDKQTPGQWTCLYEDFKLPFVCKKRSKV
ncbi:ladderlectin-like [Erpetoichthys calabaricus]|uniref:ladderlectin-like n=1 Tax=Erpetoichthys calabaricus TaxID=27687 RepID=UPI0022342D99|nr:ladderlectin-like [Erpetoichthys calabaricus]XP_051782409.1 ladderlectin-like [Erpetoichthys calabaricus]